MIIPHANGHHACPETEPKAAARAFWTMIYDSGLREVMPSLQRIVAALRHRAAHHPDGGSP
jgi:hypothetical protein